MIEIFKWVAAFAIATGGLALAEPLPDKVLEGIRRGVAAQDGNKDGKLGKEEMFIAALKRAGGPEKTNPQRVGMAVHWEFTRIDADGDGSVTAEEIGADIIAAREHKKSIAPEDAKLFAGQFSQCSYNALASVLIHFHGPAPKAGDRKELEKVAFKDPAKAGGFGGKHGWAPWTSYMVNSGTIQWNGQVTDLVGENFSLRPKADPEADTRKRRITIRYAPGEREGLEKKLLRELRRGPVVIWTPYASVMSPVKGRWRHVEHVDDDTDIVPFGPFTHAVTLLLKDDGRIAVSDGSTPNGVFYTDARTVVATSSAMIAFVRIRPGKDPEYKGVGEYGYNVVFTRKKVAPETVDKGG